MKPQPLLAALWLLLTFSSGAQAGAPITLHAENPHYFQWRGRPVIIVSSGEHYGAVVNRAFDYHRYLETLAADGLNYTRIFSGAYVEPEGAFNIERNTLAPTPEQFLCPWARSTEPGNALGGNKFDLQQWDAGYFARLKDFVATASKKGVIVEVTLFCPMYEEMQWKISPMNAANNINAVGAVDKHAVHTLDRSGGLLPLQEALVRKLVTELNPMDNVIFEICNEPYFGGVTMEWQHRIADVIVETERVLPNRHLIAQNIANKTAKIENPHPAVSVFNFHYATPPDAVAENAALNKVIGDDETGFNGNDDRVYRTEAWDFILAGGGLFNHLDYSFVVGKEDGSFAYPKTQPGGGSAAFRKQMKVLREFMTGFDFIRMKPDPSVIQGGIPEGGTARALVEPGKAIALYLQSGKTAATALRIGLPQGSWVAEWVNPLSGAISAKEELQGGAVREIKVPPYEHDIALRITSGRPE